MQRGCANLAAGLVQEVGDLTEVTGALKLVDQFKQRRFTFADDDSVSKLREELRQMRQPVRYFGNRGAAKDNPKSLAAQLPGERQARNDLPAQRQRNSDEVVAALLQLGEDVRLPMFVKEIRGRVGRHLKQVGEAARIDPVDLIAQDLGLIAHATFRRERSEIQRIVEPLTRAIQPDGIAELHGITDRGQ